MEKDNVPQDDANIFEHITKVVYAVDKDGNYVKVPTRGWEPENIALQQAWEVINAKVEAARKQVLDGTASPLLYHIEKNMLDLNLVAEYMDFSKKKVKSHLEPQVFAALDRETLDKYAFVFKITTDQLLKTE
jgi:hypothetical protein